MSTNMSIEDRLFEFLASLEVDLGGEVTPHTSLIKSGRFDSLALLNLAEWIEQEVGGPIDPTTFDLVEEWDTVTAILGFIDTRGIKQPE